MNFSQLALSSTAKKLAAAAVVGFAAVSANAYTLNVADASGTTSGSFTSLTAFEASGFASIDFGTLTSFTLTGPSGVTSALAVSPGNMFFSPMTFSAGTYTVSIVGGAASQYDGYFTTTAAVPEPETYALFAAGLGAVGFLTRRRRNG